MNKKVTRKAKKGDKLELNRSTQEVPTKQYIPPIPKFETSSSVIGTGAPWENKPMYINPYAGQQEIVRAAEPKRSAISKAGQVARHPMTAASYIAKGQPVPDYLEYGEKNAYDNAVDILNPLTYYDAGKRVVTAEHFRNPNTSVGEAIGLTALDAAMAYGVGKGVYNKYSPKSYQRVSASGIRDNEYIGSFNDKGNFVRYTQEPKNVVNSPEFEKKVQEMGAEARANAQAYEKAHTEWNSTAGRLPVEEQIIHGYNKPYPVLHDMLGYRLEEIAKTNRYVPGIAQSPHVQEQQQYQKQQSGVPFHMNNSTPQQVPQKQSKKTTKQQPKIQHIGSGNFTVMEEADGQQNMYHFNTREEADAMVNKRQYKQGGKIDYTGTNRPVMQEGGDVSSSDSVRHQAGKTMDYEYNRGSAYGTGLSNYGNPALGDNPTRDQAIEWYMQNIAPKVSYFPSAMEQGEAGDFLYNTGRDPRVYMTDQYIKSTGDAAGLPNRASYNVDTKSAAWTPELQKQLDAEWNTYKPAIDKLSTNDRRVLLNKGRDYYYQNINKVDGKPNPAYKNTWYGRIWNTNDYEPYNPDNPSFTPKKKDGGSIKYTKSNRPADKVHYKEGGKTPVYTADKNKVQAYQDSLIQYGIAKKTKDFINAQTPNEKGQYNRAIIDNFASRLNNQDAVESYRRLLNNNAFAVRKYYLPVDAPTASPDDEGNFHRQFYEPADIKPKVPYIYQPHKKELYQQIPLSQPNQLLISGEYIPQQVDIPPLPHYGPNYIQEPVYGQQRIVNGRVDVPIKKKGGPIEYTTTANKAASKVHYTPQKVHQNEYGGTMKKKVKKALLGDNIPSNMRTLDIPPTGVNTQQYTQLYNPPAIPQNVQNQYQQYQETQLANDPVALNQAKPNKGLAPVSPNVIDSTTEPYTEPRKKPNINIPISGGFDTANLRAGVFAGINSLLPDQVKKDNQNRMQMAFNQNPYGTNSQAIYKNGGGIADRSRIQGKTNIYNDNVESGFVGVNAYNNYPNDTSYSYINHQPGLDENIFLNTRIDPSTGYPINTMNRNGVIGRVPMDSVNYFKNKTANIAEFDNGGHIYPNPDLYKPFPMTPPQGEFGLIIKGKELTPNGLKRTIYSGDGNVRSGGKIAYDGWNSGDAIGNLRQGFSDQNYVSDESLNHGNLDIANNFATIQQNMIDLQGGKLGRFGQMATSAPLGLSKVDKIRGSKTSAYKFKDAEWQYNHNGQLQDTYRAGKNYEQGIAQDLARTNKQVGIIPGQAANTPQEIASQNWVSNSQGLDVWGNQHNYNKYMKDTPAAAASAPTSLPANYTGNYQGKNYIGGKEDVPIGKYGYSVPMADHGLSVENNQYKFLSPETIQFTGASHENGGIQAIYGGNHVEVEGDETGAKDPRTGDFTVFGNMPIPGTNTKFKNAGKQIGKEEAKISKLQSKAAKLLDTKDPTNTYDMLGFNAGQVMQDAVSQKGRAIEAQKLALIDVQTAMLDAAKSSGVSPEKIGKELSAKMGISMKKGKSDFNVDILSSLKNTTDQIKQASNMYKYGGIAQSGKKVKGFTDEDGEMKTRDRIDETPYAHVYNPVTGQMDLVPDVSQAQPSIYPIPVKGKGIGEQRLLSEKRIVPKATPDNYHESRRFYDYGDAPNLTKPTVKAIGKGKGKSKVVIPAQTGPLTGDNPIGGAMNLPGPQAIGPDPVPFIGPEAKGSFDSSEETVVPETNTPTKLTPIKGKKAYSFADRNRVRISDILPEIALLAQRPAQVNTQQFRPQLFDPYKVSFQDRKNEAQADFNAISRNMVNNPAALASIAAQKYNQENTINAEEFRTNQGIFSDTMNKNYATLNEANKLNLQLNDQQMVRQAQAEANTKGQKYQALASISNKYAQKRLENNMLELNRSTYSNNFAYNPRTGSMEFVGGDANFAPGQGSSSQSQNNVTRQYDAQGNLTGYTEKDPSTTIDALQALKLKQAAMRKWGGLFSSK